ncbi:unnamed protein product, partial [Iphiclides podalirius]
MGDILDDIENSENATRVTRPSLTQVKAIVEFMEKHPDLANRKQKDGMSQERFKSLWMELSDIVNGLEGARKSMKGWIKFWSDKRRSMGLKQKHINEGKSSDVLTPLELRILEITPNNRHMSNRRKSSVKLETCNGDDDDDSLENIFKKDDDLTYPIHGNPILSTETDERHISMMEKLVEVMDQQASALSQMAEATLNNSKALERIAEASHKQALAVDRLAGTFESINASVFDVRNAIMSIDYTMKRLRHTFAIHQLEFSVKGAMCPKQCDCDMENGLNRATCVDQNIVSVGVGVPREVQVYSLSHNVISELDNFCFKELGYTSIEVLNLSYNLIFWIGLHAFSGLDSLIYLDLSSNRLRFIPPDLFWDTPQLDTLDLSGNVFESLKNEPFLMHAKLQILNLNNCRIKSLPDRLFTRLPNLRKLDLSENYMITVSLEALRPLRKLQRIELRNEYLQCNPGFMAVETWIVSHGIVYSSQCKKKLPKMSEKMVSLVSTKKEVVDIESVWNVTKGINETSPSTVTTKPLTPFKKFDEEFSAFQAFVIGLEVGLAIGIVGTYVWLRQFCKCGNLICARNNNRRQRRRIHRLADGDMRANLLWGNVLNPNLETPPFYRRQLSLPESNVPVARETALHADAIRVPNRSETPPPPYNECRINI